MRCPLFVWQTIKNEKGTTRKAPPAMEGAILRISTYFIKSLIQSSHLLLAFQREQRKFLVVVLVQEFL